MSLTPRLELRQGQSLVMTPQLQQAIKLLQLSNMDLLAYVEAELERNPLLERDDRQDADGPREDRGRERDGDGAAKAGEREDGDGDGGGSSSGSGDNAGRDDGDVFDDRKALAELDGGYDNLYADEAGADRASAGAGDEGGWSGLSGLSGGSGMSGVSASRSSRHFETEDFSLEATLASERTLGEHLSEQINISIDDPARRMIARHLIDMLDEAGYLAGDVEALAERLGADLGLVEAVLKEAQGLAPPGIFARNLAECLAIQLAERDRLDPAMQALLDNIAVLAKHDFAALRKLCGVDNEDLAEMVAEIRDLNPKPGMAWGSVVVHPILPDVFVRPSADGGWGVELNSETLPRVLVNNQYHASIARGAKSSEDKTYISECHANASWLVKSLEQRARTILKVSREIVRQQDAFLVHGVQHLRPLKLKTVADAIDMHESTVSRVTSNKYMSTPRGLFELKYFFTSAIQTADGEGEHSAEAVRHRIRDLIDNEAAEKVLSDDDIVALLHHDDIKIARRTVAKYREAMHIPSSVSRRRQKKAHM